VCDDRRRPTNDIHIDNIAVSVDHARVVTVGEESFIEDMDSTNGSLLNGVPVKKHVLQHGDVIGIGKYQITYVNDASVGVVPERRRRISRAPFSSSLRTQNRGAGLFACGGRACRTCGTG